jgi:DNA-3-methyladenine glycosylase I
VAEFDDADVARLLADGTIVRNRAKIEAAIINARAVAAMREAGESLSELVWSHRPRRRRAPRSRSEVPATTGESTALARDLKQRGLRFVGPTTVYALMQACGIVNDHLAGCTVRRALEEERRRALGAFA